MLTISNIDLFSDDYCTVMQYSVFAQAVVLV